MGASQLPKNYDLWRSGYVANVLVLVATRDFMTGSRNAALPAFAVTVLRFPRRPGVFFFLFNTKVFYAGVHQALPLPDMTLMKWTPTGEKEKTTETIRAGNRTRDAAAATVSARC